MDHTARLPAETLLEIFHAARDVDAIPVDKEIEQWRWLPVPLSPEERRARLLAWISVTFVCSRWRALALQDPGLWTRAPVVLGSEWLYEFVARSGELGVYIDWACYQNARCPLVLYDELETKFIPTYYKKLRNFDGEITSYSPTFKLLSQSWPLLEDLSVELESGFPQHTLLGYDAPRLKYLSYYPYSDPLHCSSFPWEASFLCNLVMLDISFSDGITIDCMGRFLDALARMPGLNHLRVGNYRSIPASAWPCPSCTPTNRTVVMPTLQTFAIKTTWDMLHHLMRHILPPSTCTVVLSPRGGFEDYEGKHNTDLRALCERMIPWYQESPYQPVYEALEVVVDETYSRIRAFRASTSFTSSCWSSFRSPGGWYKDRSGTDLDLELGPLDNEALVLTFLSTMQRLAPDGIRILSLYIRHVSAAFVPNTLPSFRAVRALCLQVYSPDETRTLLCPSCEKTSVPFPALRVLDFRECRLFQILESEDNDIDAESNNPGSLESILATRRSVGHPVELVYLRIAEEIESAAEIQSSSYLNMSHDEIGLAIQRLRAIPGVRIIGSEESVTYDVDP